MSVEPAAAIADANEKSNVKTRMLICLFCVLAAIAIAVSLGITQSTSTSTTVVIIVNGTYAPSLAATTAPTLPSSPTSLAPTGAPVTEAPSASPVQAKRSP